MHVTILGCGGSGGVPLIGDDWGVCDPANPRNRRLRVSALVEDKGVSILLDTSPDLRQQALTAGIKRLDAVLFTHTHADHVHGIDDLRPVNRLMDAPIDIYGSAETLGEIEARFGYVFKPLVPNVGFYKPQLVPHPVNGPFKVAHIPIVPFDQDHGFTKTTGYRIGSMAYSTDVVNLPEPAFETLTGLDLWIVDCLRYQPHETHAHLEKTLGWIDRAKPRRAVLTHMNHDVDYADLCARLPAGVEAAYDGMVIDVPSA